MYIKTLVAIATVTLSSLAIAEQATPPLALATPHAKSRADVLAEFSLWRQAGLDRYSYEGADLSDPDYLRRMAEYARLRSGPQYLAERQRIQARRGFEPGHLSTLEPSRLPG